MENLNNYPVRKNSGTKMILLAFIVIVLSVFGYWMYNKNSMPSDDSTLNINVPIVADPNSEVQ